MVSVEEMRFFLSFLSLHFNSMGRMHSSVGNCLGRLPLCVCMCECTCVWITSVWYLFPEHRKALFDFFTTGGLASISCPLCTCVSAGVYCMYSSMCPLVTCTYVPTCRLAISRFVLVRMHVCVCMHHDHMCVRACVRVYVWVWVSSREHITGLAVMLLFL